MESLLTPRDSARQYINNSMSTSPTKKHLRNSIERKHRRIGSRCTITQQRELEMTKKHMKKQLTAIKHRSTLDSVQSKIREMDKYKAM